MTSIDRTAYPTFKRMTPRDLADAFTPSENEIEWARDKTSTDAHLLALTVWLKTYRRLGYFPKLEDVPDAVVEHIRGVLKLPADVAAVVDAARTAKRQRDLIRKQLGVKYNSVQARGFAEEAIEQAAQTKDNPADLINVALDVLVKKGCELPGYTTLDLATKTIRARVNKGFFTTVAGRIDPEFRSGLHQLMVVDSATRRSGFDKLKDPPKAATLTKFKQRLDHTQWLDSFGPSEHWLDGIPPGKIGHFAGEARTTTVEDFVRVGEAKRLTLLASLIHVLRAAARDEVTDMFCKRMAVIHRKGKDRLEELREQHRAESERLLEVFGDVLTAAKDAAAQSGQPPEADQVSTDPDVGDEYAEDHADGVAGVADTAVDGEPAVDDDSDDGSVGPAVADELAARTGRLVLKALESAGGLKHLAAAHQAVAAYHGNNYLPLLEQYYKSHRAALFTLVDSVTFEATSEDRSVLDALEFVQAVRARRGDWIEESVVLGRGKDAVEVSIDITTFATDPWRKTLRDKRHPGMLARRHLEVCVFSHLAAELRSGDIAVAGSDSYANLHSQMMTWEECRDEVADFCAQAGIPTDAKALVAFYKKKLTKMATTVDAGYPANTDLRLEGGRPVLARRKGAERRPSAIALEGAVLDRLPDRSLLDILARTAHLTGWHRHFGPASGSDPKIRGDKLGRYVVTTFAYGGNLGPTEVARHMRGVSAHEIYTAGNKHADGDRIHRASGDVINAFAALDVARMWGDGSVAAVDGSQIETWENNILAETSIRYGGFGGIAFRLVSDTYIALFSHFIPCGVWEAVYLLDSLLANDSDIQPDQVHADTQGQSLPVFGLAALLGFDLLPRIRNWHDLSFYRPTAATTYKHIDSLFGDNVIDWGLVEKHWPDLLRAGISIREGRLSSVTLLRRLGNHSRRNRLYKALRELGRVIRTITLSVTWNQATGKIIALSYDHELRRLVEHHDGVAAEVAGTRPARAGGRVARRVDRPRPGTPDDRRLRPRPGRVPDDVRPRRRRPGQVTANRAHVAVYVRELTSRPSRRGANVVSIDSGSGLANATIQQRLVPVRLYYDYLMEEGLRESNPVGRGRYTPGRRRGGHDRGLVPRMTKLPWIPTEQQWLDILGIAAAEPIRNRVMLALAYDAALRREELCSLRTDDLDPAHRTLRVRAETTKNRLERVVPYSAPTGVLLSGYLTHRATISRARGPLFLSESRRNHAQPLSLWTWSKVIRRIALAADVPRFSTHTTRHLCLTDLARMGWELHAIATFAGHRNTDSTLTYIHLSGRDLAEKLNRGMEQIHGWRVQMLARLGEPASPAASR